jgi:myosin heavy subunit
MVPGSDDEDDEENEPHKDDEHDDDFDSGSTVVVDEGSNSGDFKSYLPMTHQLLKYPARLGKLQLKVLELQTLNNTLSNSNLKLSTKIKETKKEHELLSRNNMVLLESLGKKELEVKEMKTKCGGLEQKDKETTRKYAALEQQNKEMRTKCDRLERENEELSRKYAASEQKREEATKVASIAIDGATAVTEGCDTLTAELQQKNKSDLAMMTEMLASMERSHSPILETITRPTEPPSQAGHQESPRKTHARSSNIPAVSKISQNPHLGYAARTRPLQPSLSQQSLSQQSPTRPTRPALIPKPNNAHVSTFNCHPPSSNGREDTGTSAKNTPTAEGSENIAQGDTEWLHTGSPDRIFRISLADDQGGQMFFKRGCSDDERPQTTSKKARN